MNQTNEAKHQRLANGRCPTHGACLTQIGADARGAIVGCTWRSCSFTIAEVDLDRIIAIVEATWPSVRLTAVQMDLAATLRNGVRRYANEMTRRALRDTRKAIAR